MTVSIPAPRPGSEAVPSLDAVIETISDINSQIAELEAERARWEQLGHMAVMEMMLHGTN